MNFEIALALFTKILDDRLSDQPTPPRGQRGKVGRAGADGKSFLWSEHEAEIRNLAREFSLKFSDLTESEIESLRGPRGEDGRAGSKGRSFIFDEHREEIETILRDCFTSSRSELKLNFSDLTDEEKEALRGEQGREGRRGPKGQDFNFEDHRDFFLGLKPKFADFTDDERAQLVLRFSHLTQDERGSLKLKFEDLSDEERLSLKGTRGQRGRSGTQGEKGETGDKGQTGVGIPGLPGPIGRAGNSGRDGRDGADGLDAPYVTDIRVDQTLDRVKFVFEFSDGTEIDTKSIDLPKGGSWFVSSGIGSSGGSGSGGPGTPGADGLDGKSAYQLWLDAGNIGDVTDFLTSLVGPIGPAGNDGVDGKSAYQIWLDAGNFGTEQDFLDSLSGGAPSDDLVTVECANDVYPGAAVVLKSDLFTDEPISSWGSLSNVLTLNTQTYRVTAWNAIADSYVNSNVIGIVESKPSSSLCRIRRSGAMSLPYSGLDVQKQYYLSADIPGNLVPEESKPNSVGEYLVPLGQPMGSHKLFVRRGDLQVVTPATDPIASMSIGWRLIQDSQWTIATPLMALANVPTVVSNDGLGPLSSHAFAPAGYADWYNFSTNKFYPNALGEVFFYRLNMTFMPTINNKTLEVMFSSGTSDPIWQQTQLFTKGAGVEAKGSFSMQAVGSPNFISDGGQIKVLAEADTQIYKISVTVFKAFKP